MYTTGYTCGTDEQLRVTVERGPHAGTWEVRFEPVGARWRVRSPDGAEEILGANEPWIGELRRELEDVMCRIARRSVAETLSRRATAAVRAA